MHTITLNDTMRYANLVSSSYVVSAKNIPKVLTDFYQKVFELDNSISSLPFFSLQEAEDGRFFVRLYNSLVKPMITLPPGLHFDSYFYIEKMASLAVYGSEYTSLAAEGTEMIVAYLNKRNLETVGPLFTVLAGKGELSYPILKVAYREKKEPFDFLLNKGHRDTHLT